MRKNKGLLLITVAISIIACFSAFAGEWKQDNKRWWYDYGDGTHARTGWSWIDGKCYYFTESGYCLTDMKAPGGHQVDESGAWVVDGVVQTLEALNGNTSVPLQFNVPDEYTFSEMEGYYFLTNDERSSMIMAFEYDPKLEREMLGDLAAESSDALLDKIVLTHPNRCIEVSYHQFSSGTWKRYITPYLYGDPTDFNNQETMTTYARIVGNYCQVVMFVENKAGIDTDAMMEVCVK